MSNILKNRPMIIISMLVASHRITAILISRFILDLQRVKQGIGSPSSIGSFDSIAFNRLDNALGSVGATLQAGDIWGDGNPQIEDAEDEQCAVTREHQPDTGSNSPSFSEAAAPSGSRSQHPCRTENDILEITEEDRETGGRQSSSQSR